MVQDRQRYLKTPKVGSLVYCRWIDSCNPKEAGWHDDEFIADFIKHPMIIEDVGWILNYCHDCALLIGGKYENDTDCAPQYHREILIPLASILKMKVIKL